MAPRALLSPAASLSCPHRWPPSPARSRRARTGRRRQRWGRRGPAAGQGRGRSGRRPRAPGGRGARGGRQRRARRAGLAAAGGGGHRRNADARVQRAWLHDVSHVAAVVRLLPAAVHLGCHGARAEANRGRSRLAQSNVAPAARGVSAQRLPPSCR
ncbi:hypothetical protein BS78_05G008300 [Paspalum vaginatum]|nr:hypothetical protein BS78_05G008300 [Paspalum vaginatum]